jgi:hypothetical protein
MDFCPICRRSDGTHWTIPHVWMPREEQARRMRWFSEDEAAAWLRPTIERDPGELGRRSINIAAAAPPTNTTTTTNGIAEGVLDSASPRAPCIAFVALPEATMIERRSFGGPLKASSLGSSLTEPPG